MTPDASSERELHSHPAVRNYRMLCLSALFLIVVCLADRGLDWWCFVPALLGSLALLAHWNHGPPLVLMSLAALLGAAGQFSRWNRGGDSLFQKPTLMDLVLCIAVLAYVLGHYRLLSLMRNIFPHDVRERKRDPSQRRCADLVTRREMAFLGFALPLWTGLSVLIWALEVADLSIPPGMEPDSEQSLYLPRELGFVWASLAMVAAVGVMAGYLRWTTATPEEQLVYLQDQCWRHTRREQSILNRWLMWARLRAQRKKKQRS